MKITKEVLDLIRSGKSINKIKQETGFGKSTIYYHYKKLRGKKIKKVTVSFKSEDELGEFLGIFSGDGSFFKDNKSHYRIRLHIGYYEKGYIEYLQKRLPQWFNKKPFIHIVYYKNKPSCLVFIYSEKEIYLLLKKYLKWDTKKTYTIQLKDFNLKKLEFNLGFLRGLIDTDGNYFHPKKRLSFATTSVNLAKQVESIIKYNLDTIPNYYIIKKKNRADLHVFTLHGKKAIRIIDRINPQNQTKKYTVVV